MNAGSEVKQKISKDLLFYWLKLLQTNLSIKEDVDDRIPTWRTENDCYPKHIYSSFIMIVFQRNYKKGWFVWNMIIWNIYLFASSSPGTAQLGDTKFLWNNFKVQTTAYGVQEALNASTMIMTIRVNFFSRFSLTSAILPVKIPEV